MSDRSGLRACQPACLGEGTASMAEEAVFLGQGVEPQAGADPLHAGLLDRDRCRFRAALRRRDSLSNRNAIRLRLHTATGHLRGKRGRLSPAPTATSGHSDRRIGSAPIAPGKKRSQTAHQVGQIHGPMRMPTSYPDRPLDLIPAQSDSIPGVAQNGVARRFACGMTSRAAANSVAWGCLPDHTVRSKRMAKSKGGTFRGRDAKAAPANPLPQTARRPTMPSLPRVAPRTRASPKGR